MCPLLNPSLRFLAAPSVYPAVVAAETLDLPPVNLTGHGCLSSVSTAELVGPLGRVEARLTEVGGGAGGGGVRGVGVGWGGGGHTHVC